MEKLHQLQLTSSPSPNQAERISAQGPSATLFEELVGKAQEKAQDNTATAPAPQPGKSLDLEKELPSQKISLGIIDKQYPTVSELIFGSTELKSRGWEIIHAQVNRNKPYHTIPAGTEILYDPATRELCWYQSGQTATMNATPSLVTNATAAPGETSKTSPPEQRQQLLGVITEDSPTVSHLLKDHPRYKDRIWSVLADPTNQDKPYTTIAKGTRIYIDSESESIIWQGLTNKTESPLEQDLPSNSPSFPPNPLDLSEAVQPYIGKPYREINCYGLLVRGLKNLGMDYTGKDGLRDRLTSMAKEKGLPDNAFLNGEGIVTAAGRKIHSQSYPAVANYAKEAEKAYQEMEHLLQKGQILSFSTKTKGHTGIISRHNHRWTFINSGRMDHHIAGADRSHKVGEENLVDEIRNWFKTAHNNRESLLVTLGQVDQPPLQKEPLLSSL